MASTPDRPLRLLDGFCGAGGASMGYHRAGFEVVGFDIEPHPSYPFEFIQADARDLLQDLDFLRTFDVLAGSPPCQELSRTRHLRDAQGGQVKATGINMIPETREAFQAAGRPYVIENVDDARPHLHDPVRLCGSSFGLRVRRHRLFECNVLLMDPPPCDHKGQGRPVGIYGRMSDDIPDGGRTARNIEEAREAMGVDWMRWRSTNQEWGDLKESIPPAYSEWIGRQLHAYVSRGDVTFGVR